MLLREESGIPVAELDSWFAQSLKSVSKSDKAFTYNALGRRVNETVGNLTTVRPYSDSSDNPEWTTQQSGANLTTEIYTGSLGAGLAVTTTFKGTVKTASMQLTDIRGHTVTTLDLDSNSVGAWRVYDSFGNPQTSQTNNNLINYSSYSQQERATSATGLILMGARVYNSETNQFTSKDPIKGGNENSYTYPNDPINGSDFSGLWSWFDVGITLLGSVLGALVCVSVAVACLVGGIVLGGLGGFLESAIEANQEGYTGEQWNGHVLEGIAVGMITGLIWGGRASGPLRKATKKGIDLTLTFTRKKFLRETFKGATREKATNEALKESWKHAKNYYLGLQSSKKEPTPQQSLVGLQKFRNR